MSTDLAIAIVLYVVMLLYLYNNNKVLLVQYSNTLPVLALFSYYIVSLMYQ